MNPPDLATNPAEQEYRRRIEERFAHVFETLGEDRAETRAALEKLRADLEPLLGIPAKQDEQIHAYNRLLAGIVSTGFLIVLAAVGVILFRGAV